MEKQHRILLLIFFQVYKCHSLKKKMHLNIKHWILSCFNTLKFDRHQGIVIFLTAINFGAQSKIKTWHHLNKNWLSYKIIIIFPKYSIHINFFKHHTYIYIYIYIYIYTVSNEKYEPCNREFHVFMIGFCRCPRIYHWSWAYDWTTRKNFSQIFLPFLEIHFSCNINSK